MKKYMFVLFILAIACAFSVSAVMAADLETYDFDGKFTLEMEKGLDFNKSTTDQGFVTYVALKNNSAIGIMYVENEGINNESIQEFYTNFEGEGYNNIGTDGNVTIFEKGGAYGTCTYKDGIIVFVVTQDKDVSLNAAKSIKFS